MDSRINPTDLGIDLNPLTTNSNLDADALIIESINEKDEDSVNVSFADLYKSLSVEARKIIDALNAELKTELPDGIQSLSPEQVTPDATASRIVQGITALFDIYAKQNPNLAPEELLSSFMEQARKGVDQGYGDALHTLEGLGAFEFDGVLEGVQKTKELIEAKFVAYEAQKRKELGLDVAAEQVAEEVTPELLKQAGSDIYKSGSLDLAA